MPKKCKNVHLSNAVQKMHIDDVLNLGIKSLLVLSYLEEKLTKNYEPIILTGMHNELPFSDRIIRDCISQLFLEGYIDVQSNPGFANQYRIGPSLTKLYSEA